MDPGICFHPVYANSHTQYACTINMTNCRTKNTATPGDKKLTRHRMDIEDEDFVHCRIFLCNCQGVIRTTVNTIDILAPLINGELNVPDGASEEPHQTGI